VDGRGRGARGEGARVAGVDVAYPRKNVVATSMGWPRASQAGNSSPDGQGGEDGRESRDDPADSRNVSDH
jgi:hypothetical protein